MIVKCPKCNGMQWVASYEPWRTDYDSTSGVALTCTNCLYERYLTADWDQLIGDVGY